MLVIAIHCELSLPSYSTQPLKVRVTGPALPQLYLLNGWMPFSLPSYFYTLAYYIITSHFWLWLACMLVGYSRFNFPYKREYLSA
jgi:hypothetical protein